MPMRPNGDSLPGFDALSDTPHSVYLLHNLGWIKTATAAPVM